MKIAVLAWGSLLWSPRTLAIKPDTWRTDGPLLPIEFSRIASDGRLTLVIDPHFDDVQVYWTEMLSANLEEARQNLMEREAADSIDEIGFVDIRNSIFHIRQDIRPFSSRILQWAITNKLDAAVWTDLKPKFFEKTGKQFGKGNAVEYLQGLEGDVRERAREYIFKSPPQTQTRLRKELEGVFLQA